MKNLIYILGLIGALSSTIISCTPEDKDLNRPATFGTQGTPAKNLRVGTLGQTIWAVQNIEQVGSIVQYCLEMDRPVENSIKNCAISYTSTAPVKKSEKWNVKLVLNESGQVKSATGELISGYATVVYRTINSYMEFKDKNFFYSRTADQKIKIEISASGDIGSNVDTFKFIHQAQAEGSISEQSWNLTNLDNELILLNKGQTFSITSNNVVLDWSNSRCADARGTATAVELGKDPAIVTFDSVLAKSEKPKWSQKLPKCGSERGERQSAYVNYGLLFY